MVVGAVYVVKIFEKDGSFTKCIGECKRNGVITDFRDGLDFEVMPQDEVKPYWLQVGDRFIHADDGVMVVVVEFKMQVGRFCVDVVYDSGTRGTFSISEQFCSSITLL